MERSNRQRRAIHRILATVGLVLAIGGSARAQAIGQIFGKATDDSGGVMPGVTVTVAGSGLQRPLVAVTTSTGAYSFPSVPIGTYTVTFELSGFKKAVRPNVILTTGFSALIDMKMEVGALTTEVSVSAATPVVDTKKTTTGGTFTSDILTNIPTARDPWQILNMVPGVTLGGVNVGGSGSGQQLTPSVYGSSSNVQWNLEGGSITDMASNSSASYYNFGSLQEMQVVTGGGDVSVQSSGLYINLITKSGSNVFKGTSTLTFENARMQNQNVTEALFKAGGSGGTGLSGNPLHKIGFYDAEFGGPIKKNRLWFWGAVDLQDINVGISNFFDTSNPACVPPPTTYDRLKEVQKCLVNDNTTIKDLNGKINVQLNSTNKVQFQFTTDNKVRNHRGASSATAPEATTRQFGPGGLFAYFTPQLTHTLILSDKLVFTNQFTHVGGEFFLDNQDSAGPCGSSSYARTSAKATPTDPSCMWNIQPLRQRSFSNYTSRGLSGGTYDTVRPAWEAKTDGNYFLSNFLGGDHSLKFGLGWRKDPVLTYSHWGGDAVATIQCTGNVATGCGGTTVQAQVGQGSGIVPYQAQLFRDALVNYTWWTWSSYLQDSYSHKRLRLTGGLRQDWQASKFLGGCVPANTLIPNTLPAQCQGKADPKQPFNNISPRGSITYDLFGNGKTALRSSYSYYFASKITLASSLSNLGGVTLTWGPNQSSGACSTTANAPCWTDANHDNMVQANELIGTPTSNTARFDQATGILTNTLPVIDPDLKIGRTREAIVGVDHELRAHMRVSFDFIYRKNDRGSATYIIGIQPGQSGFPASKLWDGPLTFTDPITGITAPYFQVCQGCTRPTGTTMSTTSLSYSTYRGVTASVEKRMSNHWQALGSLTWNDQRNYQPTGSFSTSGNNPGDPTGVAFTNGYTNGTGRYTFKLLSSVNLPWGFLAAMNSQIQDGAVRTRTVNGPGTIYGGTSGTISKATLEFEPRGTTRLKPIKLLDLNVSKTLSIPGSRRQVKLMIDCFNVFNINTVRSYSSDNISLAASNNISTIVPPRIFRVGTTITF